MVRPRPTSSSPCSGGSSDPLLSPIRHFAAKLLSASFSANSACPEPVGVLRKTPTLILTAPSAALAHNPTSGFQSSTFDLLPLSFATRHPSLATIPFRIPTSAKPARNPFRIRTYKTKDLKPFRIRTYEKTPGGGAPRPVANHRAQIAAPLFSARLHARRSRRPGRGGSALSLSALRFSSIAEPGRLP